MCYGIIAILMLINVKLDDQLNANRSKPMSAIWASWTLGYLVKYDIYLCLKIGLKITVTSIRLDVNQLTSLLELPQELS